MTAGDTDLRLFKRTGKKEALGMDCSRPSRTHHCSPELAGSAWKVICDTSSASTLPGLAALPSIAASEPSPIGSFGGGPVPNSCARRLSRDGRVLLDRRAEIAGRWRCSQNDARAMSQRRRRAMTCRSRPRPTRRSIVGGQLSAPMLERLDHSPSRARRGSEPRSQATSRKRAGTIRW